MLQTQSALTEVTSLLLEELLEHNVRYVCMTSSSSSSSYFYYYFFYYFFFLRAYRATSVRYAEIRFCPTLHCSKGLSEDEIVEAVVQGFQEGSKKTGIKGGVLICALR